MSVDVRYRVERIALALMSASGVVVLIADLLGWLDALAPGGALPKVTLLILSTVTVFLLLEIDRLRKLDVVEAQVTRLDETLRTEVARLDSSFQAQLAKLDIRYGVSEPFPPVLGHENQVNVQVADNMTPGSDIGMRIPARRHKPLLGSRS